MLIRRRDVKARMFSCLNCLGKEKKRNNFVSNAKSPRCPWCSSSRVILFKEVVLNARRGTMAKKKEAKQKVPAEQVRDKEDAFEEEEVSDESWDPF
jgi:hypothetical protein